MKITIHGEALTLLPQRALFRPKNRTLYIADTHWGKSATFRAHYIPLPEGLLADDLRRLSAALERTSAERLIILGDLTHTQHSLDPAVIETVQVWRENHAGLSIQLVAGNHDRHTKILPERWNIDVLDAQVEDGGFILAHKPHEVAEGFVFCGHLHPTWTLYGRGKQQMNVPCFIETSHQLIFPAFSRFTGSTTYQFKQMQHVYGITATQVVMLV